MKNFYKSNVLLAAVGTLIIVLIIIDVYVFRHEPLMFWVSLPILLCVSGLALGKLLQIRQSEYWYFEQLSEEIRSTDSMSLVAFPLPICVVDEERSVIWSNDCFNEMFFTPSEDESSINKVTDVPLELFGSDGREIGYEENHFRVYSVAHDFIVDSRVAGKPVIFGNDDSSDAVKERITMLIFRDITDLRKLQITHEMSKPVVMIVMVDNYEELLSGAKESERAYVTIQVDRLIEEYFAENRAVLKKMTGDKFLIVLEQQYLDQMIKDNMALINKAHEIIVRDRKSVV